MTMCTLMSYKECLALALQEGALDIVLALLRSHDKIVVHEVCVCVCVCVL